MVPLGQEELCLNEVLCFRVSPGDSWSGSHLRLEGGGGSLASSLCGCWPQGLRTLEAAVLKTSTGPWVEVIRRSLPRRPLHEVAPNMAGWFGHVSR